MIYSNRIEKDTTTLYYSNGCWTTPIPFEEDPLAEKWVETDAEAYYCMYSDDICCDVILYRVKGKWGLLPKIKIAGMGYAQYGTSRANPFVYDDFEFLTEGNVENDEKGPHEEGFYVDKLGYIAVRRERKWGIVRVYKKSWEQVFEELVVPCSFSTLSAALERISIVHTRQQNTTFAPQRYTPNHISWLNSNQIFVFGSNIEGMHGAGAAKDAMNLFGAEWGKGVGCTGQCYAIPTMHGGIEEIRPYVEDFIRYAEEHPELEFLVTPIGCGIAGFKPKEMAPLFRSALKYRNILLPKSFVDAI